MASRTDLATQQRHAQLRERQRAQRTAVDQVALAVQRVSKAEALQAAQNQVDQAADELARARQARREMAEQLRATPAGRRLGGLDAERAAAAAVIAAAVDAFGSVATAADALGMTERSIRGYLAERARAQTIADPQ